MRTLVRTRTVTSHMIFTCRKSANSWEIITAFPCAFTGTGHGHGLSYHTTRTYTHNHEQTRASRAVRCWVGARRQQKCRTGGERRGFTEAGSSMRTMHNDTLPPQRRWTRRALGRGGPVRHVRPPVPFVRRRTCGRARSHGCLGR
jgi:hypothetical protein